MTRAAMACLDPRRFPGRAILAKAPGKTTTDHIAPAGPWLRFRGNLERFSDACSPA